jgi:hypothetical protein
LTHGAPHAFSCHHLLYQSLTRIKFKDPHTRASRYAVGAHCRPR